MDTSSSQSNRYIIIAATVAYVLSLGVWLLWVGMLWLGPDRSVPLLMPAWIVTMLYPLVVSGSLVWGWVTYLRGKFNLWVVLAPMLYLPLLCVVGFAAMWQVASR